MTEYLGLIKEEKIIIIHFLIAVKRYIELILTFVFFFC
jgi:hypothetical protein